MPYSIDDKLVVAIASNALFDLSESDRVFREEGTEAYRRYQRESEERILEPGVAFPFIKRLLNLNDAGEKLVEVVLLSRNDPDTGLRVMNSIEAHGLDITRGAFLNGRSPHRYIPRFGAKLFLTASEEDVREAIKSGHPAGIVLPSHYADDPDDDELRIAFDFDGVLIDDEAEQVFKRSGLEDFHASEAEKALMPHTPGLMKDLLHCIAEIQHRELQQAAADPNFEPKIRVAIVTARNAPSHNRMVTTLALQKKSAMPPSKDYEGYATRVL
jgi:5'-nucleotidase